MSDEKLVTITLTKEEARRLVHGYAAGALVDPSTHHYDKIETDLYRKIVDAVEDAGFYTPEQAMHEHMKIDQVEELIREINARSN